MSQKEVYNILEKNKGKWFNTMMLRDKFGININKASRAIRHLLKTYEDDFDVKTKKVNIGKNLKKVQFVRLKNGTTGNT